MEDIGTLLVKDIKYNSELMIESVGNGDTSASCAAMEAVRVLSQFGAKLVRNNYLTSKSLTKDLREIEESILVVIKKKYDDSGIAQEGINEVRDLIFMLG